MILHTFSLPRKQIAHFLILIHLLLFLFLKYFSKITNSNIIRMIFMNNFKLNFDYFRILCGQLAECKKKLIDHTCINEMYDWRSGQIGSFTETVIIFKSKINKSIFELLTVMDPLDMYRKVFSDLYHCLQKIYAGNCF